MNSKISLKRKLKNERGEDKKRFSWWGWVKKPNFSSFLIYRRNERKCSKEKKKWRMTGGKIARSVSCSLSLCAPRPWHVNCRFEAWEHVACIIQASFRTCKNTETAKDDAAITDYAMSYDSGDNFYRKTIAIIIILHPYDNGTLYDCHTEHCLHVNTVVRKKVVLS